ncbi:MAG TPA: matrixin family metalloprotease, partial [Terriglobia bacterium]|nr:matrixin family metalloprotease [Terriglobia bacterium]
TRNSSSDDSIVTVTRPLEYMVTGGGYLINQESAGVYAGDDGLRTNFGFNVKFNKQLTALQGHANVIIRQDESVYQVKTNAMQSLGVDPVTHKATFVSKANLQDITDPSNVESLGGNLTLIVTITDPGEPGSSDTIGFTLWRGTQLLFSSNWTGTQTIEQLLDGGNLVIHTGGRLEASNVEPPTNSRGSEVLTQESLQSIAQKAIEIWSASGISKRQAQVLDTTRFVVADLAGSTLGISLGDTVWIDKDGAGSGWSVDGASAQPDAQGTTFDLLTVVIHELGHTLGFDHSEGEDVMHSTLSPGVRALPSTFEQDVALAYGYSIQPRISMFALEDHERPGSLVTSAYKKSPSRSLRRAARINF